MTRRTRRVFLAIAALACAGLASATLNQWVAVGPYRRGGQVLSLAVDPKTPSILYAGTETGLFRSSDAGASWSAINDGLTNVMVTDVAVDPVTTSNVYAVTRYPGGVFKSTDSGRSWSLVRYLPPEGQEGVVAIDPADPRIVFVANTFGLLKSVDGGASWAVSGETFGGDPVTDVAIDPSDPSTVYAASGRIYRSTDGGATFTVLGSPTDARFVRMDPSNPSTLYALAHTGVYRSLDRGSSWALVDGGVADPFDLAFDPASSSTLYVAAGQAGVVKSTDGGASWRDASAGLPGGPNRLLVALAVGGSSALYAADHGPFGGVFQSADGAGSWVDTRGSFTPVSVLSLATAAVSPVVYAATDAGVFRTLDRGMSWSARNGGLSDLDVNEVVPNPSDDSILYARTATAIAKSIDGGAAWSDLADGPASASVLSIAAQSPVSLYAATPDGLLWRSTDGGTSWQTSQPFAHPIRSIAVDPRDASVVFAGTEGDFRFGVTGAIYRSADAGSTWTQVFSGINSSIDPEVFDRVVFDPQDSSILYATWFGRGLPSDIIGPGGVYKSTDGGETWASILFGNPVSAFAIDPQRTSTIYLTQPGGVQRSVDGGATFTPLPMGGFPQSFVSIVSLATHPADPSTVYAAAVGQGPNPLGVYRATFAGPCGTDDTAICLNDGRFRVEVGWQRTAAGAVQHAHGVAVSTESGYFWFQDADSAELMIKVLDGRSVNGFFWVFSGALTDRAYTITVTDLLTGQARTYVNEQGQVASVADTQAFSGEGAGAPQRVETGALALAGRSTGATPDVCIADSSTLCLSRGRFRVQAVWQCCVGGPIGVEGVAVAIGLTDSSGAFSFSDPNSVEIAVKVLDGTFVNGHAWVFLGGLSSRGYTVTVTDTATGLSHAYEISRGALQSIADTSTF